MPMYSYECSHCNFQFDEFCKSWKNSGKTLCQKCGNNAFKIPAIFNANVFKQREFADGTKTPDYVRTPSQERSWLKSQGITYDAPPIISKKERLKESRNKKFVKDGFYGTSMEHAFKKAVQKVDQGFKPTQGKKQREVKSAVKNWT